MAKILIGITGSIAAIKTVSLIHALIKAKHECCVIISKDGLNFITPTSLRSIGALVFIDEDSNHYNHTYSTNANSSNIQHINLGKWADYILIAPITANTIAKLAHGFADNVLTSTMLAVHAAQQKILIAPAMNKNMWSNPITQLNLKILQNELHYTILNPSYGVQACGDIGFGRMMEIDEIFNIIQETIKNDVKGDGQQQHCDNNSSNNISIEKMTGDGIANNNNIDHNDNQNNNRHSCENYKINKCNDNDESKLLHGKTIIITAGATIEPIDPVRYISNRSSGKMGYALCNRALMLGARVILINAQTTETFNNSNQLLYYKKINTAHEMFDAVSNAIDIYKPEIFISVAAVCDYSVKNYNNNKIKKNINQDNINNNLMLELTPNVDIVATIKQQHPEIFTVGFAAETTNLIQYAIKKLQQKKLDMIIANNVATQNVFNNECNKVTIIDKQLNQTHTEYLNKDNIAKIILNIIVAQVL